MRSMSFEQEVEECRQRARAITVPWPLPKLPTRALLIATISKLMISGEWRGGFKKMAEAGELDWTLEAVVLRFRNDFKPEIVKVAEFRLDYARTEFLRPRAPNGGRAA
jgi:hypothetical protein